MHNDFAQVLTEEYRGRPAFQEDFNQDGKMDWAALVINDKLKEYRAYYFLASNNDLNAELLFTRKWERSEGGVVRTPMFLKPVGESGLSSRKYNSLTEDDDSALEIEIKAAYYTSVPAIELWTGGYGDETDSSVGGMAYCSKTWYYEKGVLKSFGACD